MRSPAYVLVGAVLIAGCSSTYIEYAQIDAAESPVASSRVLFITVTRGACDSVRPAEVTESAAEVRVRIPLRVQRGDCRSIGVSLQVELELREPLGDRAVIDAVRGVTLPVRNG